MAARHIMGRVRKIAAAAAGKITDVFGAALIDLAQAKQFFEGDEFAPLDTANPFWDFTLETDSSDNFSVSYDSEGEPSLHL